MTKKEQSLKSLPLGETLKRTFICAWNDHKIWLNAILFTTIFITLQVILQNISFCDNLECDERWHNRILSLILTLISVGIITTSCRTIVLKTTANIMSVKFWKTILFYLAAMLIFAVALILPMIILGIALMTITPSIDISLFALILSLAMVVLAIAFAPLLLVFPSIAVEDYDMLSPKKLFKLAQGNHNKIFWGLLVAMLPLALVLIALTAAYVVIYGQDAIKESVIMPIIGMIIQLTNTYIKGIYYAHIYQFFKFVEKKEKNSAEA